MSTTAVKTKWVIDPTHSEIQFKVKHMLISTVTGQFNSFNGYVEAQGDDFENATAYFEADINSLDTNQPDRDGHLKSDDFFNAEKHPKLTFTSDSITKKGDDQFAMTGDLTIRDITKKVTLDVTYGGTMKDPYNNIKAGFEVTGKINRKEYGLKWNGITEAGQIVVSDEVRILLNIELIKSV